MCGGVGVEEKTVNEVGVVSRAGDCCLLVASHQPRLRCSDADEELEGAWIEEARWGAIRGDIFGATQCYTVNFSMRARQSPGALAPLSLPSTGARSAVPRNDMSALQPVSCEGCDGCGGKPGEDANQSVPAATPLLVGVSRQPVRTLLLHCPCTEYVACGSHAQVGMLCSVREGM
jgi:hypothetical protein